MFCQSPKLLMIKSSKCFKTYSGKTFPIYTERQMKLITSSERHAVKPNASKLIIILCTYKL